MLAKYTALWELGNIYRGDTIRKFYMVIVDHQTRIRIVPKAVICQIRTKRGRLLYEFSTNVLPNGIVEFPRVDGDVTATWPPAEYNLTIRYELEGEYMRTYVSGMIEILEDTSRCQTN